MNTHFAPPDNLTIGREAFVQASNKAYHLAGLVDALLCRLERKDNTEDQEHTTKVLATLAHSMADELSDRLATIEVES